MVSQESPRSRCRCLKQVTTCNVIRNQGITRRTHSCLRSRSQSWLLSIGTRRVRVLVDQSINCGCPVSYDETAPSSEFNHLYSTVSGMPGPPWRPPGLPNSHPYPHTGFDYRPPSDFSIYGAAQQAAHQGRPHAQPQHMAIRRSDMNMDGPNARPILKGAPTGPRNDWSIPNSNRSAQGFSSGNPSMNGSGRRTGRADGPSRFHHGQPSPSRPPPVSGAPSNLADRLGRRLNSGMGERDHVVSGNMHSVSPVRSCTMCGADNNWTRYRCLEWDIQRIQMRR